MIISHKKLNALKITSWLFVMLLSAWIIQQANFSADFSAFLPKQATKEDQMLLEQIKQGSVMKTFLLSIEGGTLEQRVNTSQIFAKKLQELDRFLAVQNGNQKTIETISNYLFQNRYLLSDRIQDDYFSSQQMQMTVQQSVQQLSTDSGTFIKKYFLKDPTGEWTYLLSQLANNRNIHKVGSVWASRDEQQQLLVVISKLQGNDLEALEQDLTMLNQTFHDIIDSSLPDLRLHVTGAPIAAINSRHIIKSEVEKISLISSLLIVALLLFFYRSIRLLLTGLLPVITAILVATATVSLMFDTVYGITLGFGVALIGECVDYAIYYFMHASGDTNNDDQSYFWKTIRLGVLTSLAGFSAMIGSSFPGLVQISVFAMTGILVAYFVTRFILPIFSVPVILTKISNLLVILSWIAKHRKYLIQGLIILVICAVALIITDQNSLLNKNLNALNTASNQDRLFEQSVKQSLSIPEARFFFVVNDTTQENVLIRVEALINQLKSNASYYDTVSSLTYPTLFLPSQHSQQKRLSAIPDAATLVENLSKASEALSLKSARFYDFVESVQQSKRTPIITQKTLQQANLSYLIDSMLYETKQGWVAMLPVSYKTSASNPSTEQIKNTILLGLDPNFVQYLDLFEKSNQLYQKYLNEVILASLAGLAIVLLLIGLTLQSITRLWQVITPLLLSIILVLGILSAIGEKISLFHIIGLLLVFAIGSNYALFFESITQHNIAKTNRVIPSLVLANMTTVIAFSSLSFSQVLVMHGLGITVALGTFLSLLLSAILMKNTDKEAT